MLPRILLLLMCLSLTGCAGLASQSTADSSPADPLPTTAEIGDRDIVAIAVPAQKCCDRQTLPQFLGLDKLGAGIGGLFQRVFSRLQVGLGLEGKFPGLQPQEPLKPITDPANLSEDSPPSVQAAAKIKAEQDQAKQKIQALRYLATIGCGGCYPEVEDALLAALDDCTESVRYEAVKALRGKKGTSCCYCNQDGCCSAKVQKKLNEIVNKVNDSGAYVEKSERVRRMARVVLNGCPPAFESSETPLEGPALESTEEQLSRLSNTPTSSLPNSGVIPASYESPAEGEANYCLASIDGFKLMASEMAPGKITRESLNEAIILKTVQLQFLKENSQYLGWDRSLEPVFNTWLNRKGLTHSATEWELRAYYEANPREYSLPAKVRWESVAVAFESEEQKLQIRTQLENIRERLNTNRSVTPVTVGKAEVRTFEWTQPGDINNRNLRSAIFETPIGRASSIVETPDQLILVRVLEKKKSQPRRFESVRNSIKNKLEKHQIRDAIRNVYDTVRSDYQVWTIFDQPNESPTRSKSNPAQNTTAGFEAEFDADFQSNGFELDWQN